MKREAVLLFLILLLAFSLRIYDLSNNPPGFFADEPSAGYNAYSLLQTGQDEYGRRWPLFIQVADGPQHHNPALIYSTLVSVALFGLSEFAVRLPAVIFGILTVGAIYLLAKELFNEAVGILSAFFLAISPWHVHLSRFDLGGFGPFVFLVTFSTYLFLRGLHQRAFLLLSMVGWGLSLYTYHPARLFVPLLLTGLLFIYRRELLPWKKTVLMGLIVSFVISLPLVWHIYSGAGLIRWEQVSILNKGWQWTQVIIYSLWLYLSHFSLDFLFQKGDIGFEEEYITRHSVRGVGELYWFQLPFLIVGMAAMLAKSQKKEALSLLGWLFLYPLPTAFTYALGPHAIRSIVGVIPFQLISAYGVVSMFEMLKCINPSVLTRVVSRVAGIFLGIIIFLSLGNFSDKLFRGYPQYAADYRGWQYGPREIVQYFTQVEDQYDELIMSEEFNASYIFFKFYAPDGCQKCRVGGLSKLDKTKTQLFALRVSEIPEDLDYDLKKRIFYPNGEVGFKIFEVAPSNLPL